MMSTQEQNTPTLSDDTSFPGDMTREEVWTLIETYKRAGWYDDDLIVEIDRLRGEIDQIQDLRYKETTALRAEIADLKAQLIVQKNLTKFYGVKA